MHDPTLRIEPVRLQATVYRAPLRTPVRTSFGVMHDRPALLVRVTDRDGADGWGEVWCNFPSVGAEHRARLATEIVAPLVLDRSFALPSEAFAHASAALEVLALQTGEFGPLAQALAGVDMALWDLSARRAGQPLYRLLGGQPVHAVPVYASGINPDAPERLAEAKRAEGHRAFKLKVGFGRERDLANLATLRARLGTGAVLMVDANQAWDLDEAIGMAPKLAEHGPAWLEEPLRADRPKAEWAKLKTASPVPLAAGENLRSTESFDAAISDGILSVLQPDLGKWGGFSGCVPIGRRAVEAGTRLCPHWLGGGIGLMASLHLLAAVGGEGLLEVDVNPNPLRDLMIRCPPVRDGTMAVPNGPGLGAEPELTALRPYHRLTLSAEA